MKGVAVAGGGVAGLAAATRLAEEGLRPTLFEARKILGGRATAFQDPTTGLRVDNGQHLLMGCNHSVRAFLDKIGAADGVGWQARLDLPLASKSLGLIRLRLPALPGALSALTGLLTTRGLPWADRLGAAKAMNVLLKGGPELEGTTIGELFGRLETPALARSHFLEPFSIAVLNDQPLSASARALSCVIREAFSGGPESSGLGLPRKDLESLFALPARRFIEERGGRVETQRPVKSVLVGEGGVEGIALEDGQTVEAGAVVVALPPGALTGLLPSGALPQGLDKLPASPIVSATFWFDRLVVEEPLLGLVGTTAQWAFNRSYLLGLEGPGQVVALTVSAADSIAHEPKDEIVETFLEDLRGLFPAAREARLEHYVVVKEQRATYPPRPREPYPRPGCRSRVRGLHLAGGWTSQDIPDTLEASVRSGFEAAEALLTDSC